MESACPLEEEIAIGVIIQGVTTTTLSIAPQWNLPTRRENRSRSDHARGNNNTINYWNNIVNNDCNTDNKDDENDDDNTVLEETQGEQQKEEATAGHFCYSFFSVSFSVRHSH